MTPSTFTKSNWAASLWAGHKLRVSWHQNLWPTLHPSTSSSIDIHTLLLLLLSRFSHVRLCATPQTAAHQAPPPLGFSRQEHWSGLPLPSPHTHTAAAAAAKLLQSCPTLWDPTDGSPPGCPVPGILQARTLEWVAISFSNAYKWKVKVKSLSRVRLFETPWTAAHQAPQSMGFSRQEYWSEVPLPSPHTHTTTCKIDSYQEASILHRELSSALCDDLERWDRVGRRFKREGICVHI